MIARAGREPRLLESRSMILGVLPDAVDPEGALEVDLDPGDRVILDSYLNTVREIERRIERASQRDMSDIKLPAAPEWHNQQAFETVFYTVPRLVIASRIASWCGEFANSYVMAKMKLFMR